MDILERLISRYDQEDDNSIEDLLSEITQSSQEYREMSLEERLEVKRRFTDYCKSAEKEIYDNERFDSAKASGIYLDFNSLSPQKRKHKKYVEAFVSNISVTDSLDEFYERYIDGNNVQLLLDDISSTGHTCWTSPRWAKRSDIVLFMHAKTAKSKLTKVRTEARSRYNPTSEKAKRIERAIQDQLEIYKQYGGKIFAIGQISGKPETYDENDASYFKSRVFSDIDYLFLLENPVDISEFNSFIKISMQGSITPVFGSAYERLKDLIISKNNVPDYFLRCFSTPFPHNAVNSDNWMKLGLEYRNAFTLEIQFRQCYVDYLLSNIGDQKRIYMECPCYKDGKPVTFVDNVIRINKKLLPVEIKLNRELESSLEGQCRQYCKLDRLVLDKKKGREARLSDVIDNKVLIVDTYGIYIYEYSSNTIKTLYDLDDLRTKDELPQLRELIIANLL